MANSILDSLTRDWSNNPAVVKAQIMKQRAINRETKKLKKRMDKARKDIGAGKEGIKKQQEIHDLFTGEEADAAVAATTGPLGVLLHDMFGDMAVDGLLSLFGGGSRLSDVSGTTEWATVTPEDFVYARNPAKDVETQLDSMKDALLKREGEFGDLNIPGLDTIIKMLMASEIFAGGDIGGGTEIDVFGGSPPSPLSVGGAPGGTTYG